MPNDEEIKSADISCPIACGECCSYWRDIDELTAQYPNQSYWQPCPNNTETGCRLQRNERPDICNEYLCHKANAVAFPNDATAKMMKEILERVQAQPSNESDGVPAVRDGEETSS
jgi:hypothetical protein